MDRAISIENSIDGIRSGLASRGIDDGKNTCQCLPSRFIGVPTRELLRNGIHAGYQPLLIGGDNGIANGVEGDFEIFLLRVQVAYGAGNLAAHGIERLVQRGNFTQIMAGVLLSRVVMGDMLRKLD